MPEQEAGAEMRTAHTAHDEMCRALRQPFGADNVRLPGKLVDKV